MNASFPDLRREHRTKPVPPEPHCFVADIDAPLEQEILDLSQRKRITDVHHHRGADHLGRTVEITEGILHPRRLRNATPRLKPIYTDKDRYGTHAASSRQFTPTLPTQLLRRVGEVAATCILILSASPDLQISSLSYDNVRLRIQHGRMKQAFNGDRGVD